MDTAQKAINLALKALKEKFGKDVKLEDGEQVVFQLNNCTLTIGLNGDTLTTNFIGGQPIKVDYTVDFYESEE